MPQFDIGAKSPVQVNWEENGPTNNQLKDVMEAVTDIFRDEAEPAIESASLEDRAHMVERSGNTYRFRYGRVGMIPVAAFADISATDITIKEKLHVPFTKGGIEKLADRYDEWQEAIIKKNSYIYTCFPKKSVVSAAAGRAGWIAYPEEQWWQAAHEVQRAMQQEPAFMIDTHLTNRVNNSGSDLSQVNKETRATHEQHDEYVLALSQLPSPDGYVYGTRDTVQLPLIEYGEAASAKLARVTLALSDIVKANPSIDADVRSLVTPEVAQLLANNTARTTERVMANDADAAIHGLKNTLTEGILTVAQTISLLTANKMQGYEDHDELVRAILDSDIIEQFTRLVAPGYIGPTTLSGLYMPNALTERNGKLSLSKEAFTVLHTMRKEHVAEYAAKWALYRSGATKEKPGVLGLVCPAAAPNGAITTAKSVMKHFYSAKPSNELTQ